MYGDPALWNALLGRLADITITFLRVQVAAGATAIQLFDSWAGTVEPGGLPDRRAAGAASRSSMLLADTGVPMIHFGVATGELLGMMGEAGADVIGVDWRVPLDEAVRRVRPRQGPAGQPGPGHPARPVGCNFGWAQDIIGRGRATRGTIFNLGPRGAPSHQPGRPGPAHGPGPAERPCTRTRPPAAAVTDPVRAGLRRRRGARRGGADPQRPRLDQRRAR